MKFRNAGDYVVTRPTLSTEQWFSRFIRDYVCKHGAGDWASSIIRSSGNPTRSAVQETIASLEGGCGSLLFASGMAATHCATMLLRSGDHIVGGQDIYGGSYRLFHKVCNQGASTYRLQIFKTSMRMAAAIRPTTRECLAGKYR